MSANRPSLNVLVVPPSPEPPDFFDSIRELIMGLTLAGHEVKVLTNRGLLPGTSIPKARKALMEWADLFIPVALGSGNFRYFERDWSAAPKENFLAVPVILKTNQPHPFLEYWFADLVAADFSTSADWDSLLEGIAALAGASFEPRTANPRSTFSSLPAAEVARIELRDVGCFESFDLEGLGSWVTVLGDNAAGKSTLLRAIALGLCAESDATVLLRALPGPLRREGADSATIRIWLAGKDLPKETWIETVIEAGPSGERVRQKTLPDPFPWERIFACGYGTGRSRQATSPSRDAYSPLEALRPLFDDKVDLQNPEVVLQRQENGRRRQLEQRLLGVLMLDQERPAGLGYGSAGVTVRGPWGERPFRVLSDGYRSTAQWVLDFCAWAIYAGRLDDRSEIGGVLLIDEIEQHLHPRWQREFVQRLRQQFPRTQIFTTTHTPLVASGVADLVDARLVRLKLEEDGSVEALLIEPKSLDGLRADQVLTSEAFGLVTSRNPGSDRKIDRYTALLGQDSRTEAEEAELAALAAELENELRGGETEAEREVEKAVSDALQKLVTPVKAEVLEVEAKRQLRQLFSGDESEAD